MERDTGVDCSAALIVKGKGAWRWRVEYCTVSVDLSGNEMFGEANVARPRIRPDTRAYYVLSIGCPLATA